jgi:hypothetical protein
MELKFPQHILGKKKKPQITNFLKIRPAGVECFHADGQNNRRDEANSRFSQFCERA